MKSKRQEIWAKIPPDVQICAVTKGRSLEEVEDLLQDLPQIKVIAENRWPDCEEKFQNFPSTKKHFIGHLQKNKLNKILPLVDAIQSIDSLELLQLISEKTLKPIEFTFQVNISKDPAKQGIKPENLREIIEKSQKLPNVKLIGLMTIGAQENQEKYFTEFKTLFDEINQEYFKMPILSMGTSGDFETAIKCGAKMVRLGTCLFE